MRPTEVERAQEQPVGLLRRDQFGRHDRHLLAVGRDRPGQQELLAGDRRDPRDQVAQLGVGLEVQLDHPLAGRQRLAGVEGPIAHLGRLARGRRRAGRLGAGRGRPDGGHDRRAGAGGVGGSPGPLAAARRLRCPFRPATGGAEGSGAPTSAPAGAGSAATAPEACRVTAAATSARATVRPSLVSEPWGSMAESRSNAGTSPSGPGPHLYPGVTRLDRASRLPNWHRVTPPPRRKWKRGLRLHRRPLGTAARRDQPAAIA